MQFNMEEAKMCITFWESSSLVSELGTKGLCNPQWSEKFEISINFFSVHCLSLWQRFSSLFGWSLFQYCKSQQFPAAGSRPTD